MNWRQTIGAWAFLDLTNQWRPGPFGRVTNNKVNQTILSQSDSLNEQVTGASVDSEWSQIGDWVRSNIALSV